MRLGQYTRAEIAIVQTMALQAYAFGTSRMLPRELAALNGINVKSVYRGIAKAHGSGLIHQHATGELSLTNKAVEALREGYRHGFDGKRRKAVSAR